MNIKILALATVVALAGCTNNEDELNTGSPDTNNDQTEQPTDGPEDGGNGNNGGDTPEPPVASTCSGLEGPLDDVQCTLSEQVFGALIGNVPAEVPEQLPLAQLLTCVDNTVSTRALDLVDALAASADPSSLTDPANAPLALAVTDLLGSVGGLLLSAAGQNDGNCQLDLAGGGLPGGDAGIPGADSIPGLDQLMTLLGGAGGGENPLDPSQLAAISDGLSLLSEQLRNASGPADAAPLLPETLELVADLIDDLGEVLSDPTAAPDSLQFLVTNLAANLQAIPESLLALGGGDAPGLPSGGENPLADIPVIGDIVGMLLAAGGDFGGLPGGDGDGAENPFEGTPLAGIPVIGDLLGGIIGGLTSLAP